MRNLEGVRNYALYLGLFCVAVLPYACQQNGEPSAEPTLDPGRDLVRRSVAANGLDVLDAADITFRFRDKEYRYQRADGRYVYQRWWVDSTSQQTVRDELSNNGLTRFIADEPVSLSPKDSAAYVASVNSVIYFAFLPWALRDGAAVPVHRGRDTIKGASLEHLTVTFAAEGGGTDFQDKFEYWFDPETLDIRYLAYAEAPGDKEPRFREAYNSRTLASGVRVRDYRNYMAPNKARMPVEDLGPAFDRDELELLSVIALEF